MSRPAVILGAGGHARVLTACLRELDVQILGCTGVEEEADSVATRPAGVAYLGDDQAVLTMPADSVHLVNGLGSVGSTLQRTRLHASFKDRGYRFASVVHPAALIASDVEIGEGTQIMAGAVLQSGCRLDENVLINTRAVVDHDCHLCIGVHVAPGATLSGGVVVGAGAHIGTGASIRQGVRIGAGSVVGVGAAVINDIQEGVTVAGVPARIMK